jgi:hypothetical protein
MQLEAEEMKTEVERKELEATEQPFFSFCTAKDS